MRTITRGAAVAVLCTPLLLGACTIGDAGQADETTTPVVDTEAPPDKPVPESGPETGSESEAPEDPDQPDAEPVETDPDAPGARGLAIGDCVADMDQLDGTGDIDVVDCGGPHAGEVYAQVDIAGKNLFPGNEPLGQEAGAICGGDAFTGYVGIGFPESSLDVVTMMPSKESWAQEDRTVTCVVTDPTLEQIDGTLEQSWR
ncbi:septum formation family protein [Corynebacterium glyciniphilum]|uniref:septum formation family protein n=1 Tax=Corynebacterium glyciniphilum TaxID=1404244 RepID=UPI001642C22A|nr:septum formation family protein [Corynebacterium glyciniphilum]